MRAFPIHTSPIYSKREAMLVAASMQKEHKGHFVVEQVGRKWRAFQLVTHQQMQRQEAQSRAAVTLAPEYDWLSQTNSYSIYYERDQLKAKLDAWQMQFAENPLNAFDGARETVQIAADYTAACTIIRMLEEGRDAASIAHSFSAQAAREAEYESLSVSTSPLHTLAEQAKRIAWRKCAQKLTDYIAKRNRALGDIYAIEMGML